MQTLSQRITVQSPQPAVATVIGVTNHGVTTLGNHPETMRNGMIRHRGLAFLDKSLERRGIPESALHD